MTKKEFKRYMQQGHGRCAIILQKSDNIEKYKDVVLWGCTHRLSFDTQCEGTRASYVYELTTCFNDEEYFLNPIIEELEKNTFRDCWKFHHLVELLQRFAENGNKSALSALKAKYAYLHSRLINKHSFKRYDFERDYFEAVCFSLKALGGIDDILKIACDMGELFEKNPHYFGSSFDWFFSQMSNGIGKRKLNSILKRDAKKSKYIKVFYEEYTKALNALESFIRPIKEPLSAFDLKKEIDEAGTLLQSEKVRFKRLAEDSEKEKLAKIIIGEPNEDKKIEMLSVFAFSKPPFSYIPHNIIIEYANSKNEALKNMALDILTNCQSIEARDYALELFGKGEHTVDAIKILLVNYKDTDKEFLLSHLKNIKVDYSNETFWHNIGSKILEADDVGVNLPKEFFLYIYNTTLCSCCREYAIRALAKRRGLTRDIIEECRFDSNDDISAYVNRISK